MIDKPTLINIEQQPILIRCYLFVIVIYVNKVVLIYVTGND